MATIKAEYYRLNGNSWDIYFFKTTHDLVDGLSTNYARINSPTFTGIPTAPSPVTTDNSSRLATTAYVRNAINYYASSGGPELVRSRTGTDPLTSAVNPIPLSGIAIGDTLMLEVNKYPGAAYNPKVVTITLGKAHSNTTTDADIICSWSTWNGTTERINSFAVGYVGGNLYFTDFKYVDRSVSGSTMTYRSGTYTLYVGRIWKL